MEKRKESLSVLKLCRFCLSQNQSLSTLYDKRLTPKSSVDLPLKILSCVSMEIFPSDKMPSYICNYCKFFMDLFYKYKQIVRQADENILKYIQNGTSLESIFWPTSLLTAYKTTLRTTSLAKTVVDGDTTVQVTTHNVSDSEEDEEENVYNVTIADGSDEGSKSVSTIKVVTSKDGQDSPQNQSQKGFTTFKKIVRQVHPQKNDRPYICTQCGKTFVKSYHYTRHLHVKHGEAMRSARGPFGQSEQYICDQCDDSFSNQDELVYHSAIHATQNLICPLCQEKFPNVDAVTTHIKSHVNGVEFMCDFCELVFTTKEKLESHILTVHEDEFNNELPQDDSSVEMDAREEEEDEDDDNGINVKDKGDHMLIEIKKADEFMLQNTEQEVEEKFGNTNSEESETEVTYTELSTVDTLRILQKQDSPQPMSVDNQSTQNTKDTISSSNPAVASNDAQTPDDVIKKAEEIQQKQVQQQIPDTVKKEKSTKSESNKSVGASNKSLQLLEKELQELKRTNNSRSEVTKTVKSNEPVRIKRAQLHSSTPKIKEEKKTNNVTKTPATEKKIQQERRIVTKENKEPKESKEKVNTSTKEDKEKEVKEKDTAPTTKSVVKNSADEGIRRSTRPSKVKDYAKMIRDKADEEESDDADDDDEEYKADKTPEKKRRKSVGKVHPKMVQTTIASTNLSKMALCPTVTITPRKRGRPRKEPSKEIPAKVKKEDIIDEINLTKTDSEDSQVVDENISESKVSSSSENTSDSVKILNTEQAQTSAVLVSPSGQTLKKVPIKALPPGVKPLPLPVSSRTATVISEMQIGKKIVKVKKLVMTKAEVEAMTEKGLVEMKDGTMVLKRGIQLSNSDPLSIKSSLVGDKVASKESMPKREKGTPSRCDLEDDTQMI